MYLRAIYILPQLVLALGRPIVGIYIAHRYMNVKIGRQNIAVWFCFGNNEATQFHFWEYINRNLTFIMDSHRPFICSVGLRQAFLSVSIIFVSSDGQWRRRSNFTNHDMKPSAMRCTELQWDCLEGVNWHKNPPRTVESSGHNNGIPAKEKQK